MQFIGFDVSKYQYEFGPNTTYGHVMHLVEANVKSKGLVVDLGCGHGALAEPLRERGFTYFGVDIDQAHIADLGERGFAGAVVDLQQAKRLSSVLGQALGETDQPLVAILLLDVIEHLPEPISFLQALRDAVNQSEPAPLFTSVPNVSHIDVATSLLRGQWKYTPAGLLDETHVRFFSESELHRVFWTSGWSQIGAHDFVLPESEQFVSGSVYSGRANVAGLLEGLRQSGEDKNGKTYQFVRAFAPTTFTSEVRTSDTHDPDPDSVPGVSVIVRTTGDRPELLDEALLSLAAQSNDRFEVLLMVHSRDADRVSTIRKAVGEFPPSFSRRVRVRQVIGGERARPLNEGIRIAVGRYVAFLDDDDCVATNWIEAFLKAEATNPSQVVRSIVADQTVERTKGGIRPYILQSAPKVDASRLHFDFIRHLSANRTPICGFAVPRVALVELGLRFNETRKVLEDWEFLLKAAMMCGVVDTGLITAFYRRWSDSEASFHAIERATWRDTRLAILNELDTSLGLLPPGWIESIRELFEERRVLRMRLGEVRSEARSYTGELKELRRRLSAIERSTSWRITKPIRWLGDRAKRLSSGLRMSLKSLG